MRNTILAVVFLAQATPTAAKDPATEVFLSADAELATVGEAASGETRAYILNVRTNGPVRFLFDAENDNCGYDISRSTQLGVLPSFGRFPVRHDEQSVAGEVYTMSFFQTRTAWVEKVACRFSLRVE